MINKLQESNKKAFDAAIESKKSKIVEGLKKNYGISEKILDFNAPDFSIKKFREGAYALVEKLKLQEAHSETTFGQLLRAGVQNAFNNDYQKVETTYDAVVKTVTSNKRQEFYAPLERAGFPKRTEKGEQFPEISFKGLDVELINAKFGAILAFERELMDDDQTGQIVSLAGQLGENTRIQEEAYIWGKISGVAGLSFDGEAIPVSSTYGTVYATGVPGTSGGIHGQGRGVNALANGRLSQTQIQNGMILAKKMLDQSGRPMLVKPSVLAVSPQDEFFAKVLMGSMQSPSMSSTATADIGKVGGIMGINPIKGAADVVVTRFLPDYAALLVDAGKGFNHQIRDAVEVVQENPQSGPAFTLEVFRYKVRSRWEADFIDPKFYINLNPGLSST